MMTVLSGAIDQADQAGSAALGRPFELREGGIDSRRSRPVIDQAAAVVILQQYLDSRRSPT